MLVKYIKNGVSAKIGAIRTHTDAEARVLIKLGIVEPYKKTHSVDSKKTTIASKTTRKRQPKKGEAFGQLPQANADENTKSISKEKDV